MRAIPAVTSRPLRGSGSVPALRTITPPPNATVPSLTRMPWSPVSWMRTFSTVALPPAITMPLPETWFWPSTSRGARVGA
jgi:hypothetical protein